MPVTPTYPGVYVEEIPSGVHTITGVATSIGAFIGYFPQGPMNQAVHIFSIGDFTRAFGGLAPGDETGYAIQQFFLNGGTEAWVVRVAAGSPLPATALIAKDTATTTAALIVTASNEGLWGNNLGVKVDTKVPVAGEFNLTIAQYTSTGATRALARPPEVFYNLTLDSSKTNYVQTVVNDPGSGSKLVTATAKGAATDTPAPNGTLSGAFTSTTIPALPKGTYKLLVGIDTAVPAASFSTATLNSPGLSTTSLADALSVLAGLLTSAIRTASPGNPAFAGATVDVVSNSTSSWLRVLAGPGAAGNQVQFDVVTTPSADNTAKTLQLVTSATSPALPATFNVQEYALGVTTAIPGHTAQLTSTGAQAGADGTPPDANALLGDMATTGLFALEKVDLFNLLCIPRTAAVAATDPNKISATDAAAVIAVAETYCERRRAFFLMDTPAGIADFQSIQNWLAANDTLRHRNAALHYPRVQIPDSLNSYRLRSVGASGTLAGLFARTDAARGVWKAPAGTEATLSNVQALDDVLTDAQNGALNPLAINCLRNFPVYGEVSWGARTLEGADQAASEWKYIPVRRTALFIEESLFRGTKWVVFEPNDEPLWAQIRLNVGSFMHTLFRQGAFQGASPRDAYFVKCDSETTTQNDIDQGIVNIVVGFAPLKPAEFVIIQLQQIAGQLQV